MEEKIEIIDERKDKKYFTIIPNYILNHSSAIDQALYLQITRLAGENGKCFASMDYFMKHLGITKPTIRKSLKYLIDHNWIKEVEGEKVETLGGKQKLRTFKVIDIWGLNMETYAKGGKNKTPLNNQRGEKIISKGGKNKTPNNNYITNNNIILSKDNISEQSSQVNELMSIFYKINPTLNWGNKTIRKHAEMLINKFPQDWKRMAEAVISIQGQKFAPVITTPKEMWEKLSKVKIYFDSKKGREVVEI